jgi:hypothetical protein
MAKMSDNVESYAKGGTVKKTGMKLLHKGEKVIPADLAGAVSTQKAAGRMKPKLTITANVDSFFPSDNQWVREDIARKNQEIAVINDKLKNWSDLEVARQAKASLKAELQLKKARLAEAKARLNSRGY